MTEQHPPRNPETPCPACACRWLYTDFYDVCYQCGRNVEAAALAPLLGKYVTTADAICALVPNNEPMEG